MLPSMAPTNPPAYKPKIFTSFAWQFLNVAVLERYPINPPVQFVAALMFTLFSWQPLIVILAAD